MTTDPTPRDAGTQPGPSSPEKARRVPFTTLLNLLLFVGLIVLYALYFLQLKAPATGEEDTRKQLTEMQEQIARAGASFAYVSSDRLMEEYDLAIRMREEFEGEQRRLESDLERRQRTFQNEVERFQQNIQAGTISMDQAQIREQELMQMQQELIQSSDTYRERLARKEYEMNLELLEKISEFLGRYNQEAGYDFILSYSTGGGILFADPSHDITAEVVARLNNEHANTQ